MLGTGKAGMSLVQTLPSKKTLLAGETTGLVSSPHTRYQVQMSSRAQRASRSAETDGKLCPGGNPERLPRRHSICTALPSR